MKIAGKSIFPAIFPLKLGSICDWNLWDFRRDTGYTFLDVTLAILFCDWNFKFQSQNPDYEAGISNSNRKIRIMRQEYFRRDTGYTFLRLEFQIPIAKSGL